MRTQRCDCCIRTRENMKGSLAALGHVHGRSLTTSGLLGAASGGALSDFRNAKSADLSSPLNSSALGITSFASPPWRLIAASSVGGVVEVGGQVGHAPQRRRPPFLGFREVLRSLRQVELLGAGAAAVTIQAWIVEPVEAGSRCRPLHTTNVRDVTPHTPTQNLSVFRHRICGNVDRLGERLDERHRNARNCFLSRSGAGVVQGEWAPPGPSSAPRPSSLAQAAATNSGSVARRTFPTGLAHPAVGHRHPADRHAVEVQAHLASNRAHLPVPL